MTTIPERAPWWQQRGEPLARIESPLLLHRHAQSGGWLFPNAGVYQKWGWDDDVIRSEHIEFSVPEWERGVLMSKWVEVIALDWKRALRARVEELLTNEARIKRSGVELVVVYLPVFRADRLQDLGDFG